MHYTNLRYLLTYVLWAHRCRKELKSVWDRHVFRSPLPSLLISPLSLEVGLLNAATGSGERYPSGIWGRAPAEIDFVAF